MDRYVARANVDHYIALLNGSDLAPQDRNTITKLLISEEDKLSHDLEHLEFAEIRTAKARDQVDQFKRLRDGFAEGSTDRAYADRILGNFESIHGLMEQFCHRMRKTINSRF